MNLLEISQRIFAERVRGGQAAIAVLKQQRDYFHPLLLLCAFERRLKLRLAEQRVGRKIRRGLKQVAVYGCVQQLDFIRFRPGRVSSSDGAAVSLFFAAEAQSRSRTAALLAELLRRKAGSGDGQQRLAACKRLLA